MQNRSSGQKEMDIKGGIFLVVEASGRSKSWEVVVASVDGTGDGDAGGEFMWIGEVCGDDVMAEGGVYGGGVKSIWY